MPSLRPAALSLALLLAAPFAGATAFTLVAGIVDDSAGCDVRGAPTLRGGCVVTTRALGAGEVRASAWEGGVGYLARSADGAARVGAIDARTGEALWDTVFDVAAPWGRDTILRAIAMAGEDLVVAGETKELTSADQVLFLAALEPADGSLLWIKSYPYPGSEYAYVGELVVSADASTAYVVISASPSDWEAHGYGHGLLAVATADGATLWESRTQSPGGTPTSVGGGAAALSPGGSSVLVGLHDVAVYDAATGEELWSAPFPSPTPGRAQVQAVAISPDGAMGVATGYDRSGALVTRAHDMATGALLWSDTLGRASGEALAFFDGGDRLLVSGSGWSSAHDSATGVILWRTSLGSATTSQSATLVGHARSILLAPDESRAYIVTSNGLAAVALGTGSEVWQRRIGGPVGAGAALTPAGISFAGTAFALVSTDEGALADVREPV